MCYTEPVEMRVRIVGSG